VLIVVSSIAVICCILAVCFITLYILKKRRLKALTSTY
jgi:hypothetical protein